MYWIQLDTWPFLQLESISTRFRNDFTKVEYILASSSSWYQTLNTTLYFWTVYSLEPSFDYRQNVFIGIQVLRFRWPSWNTQFTYVKKCVHFTWSVSWRKILLVYTVFIWKLFLIVGSKKISFTLIIRHGPY